MRGKIFTMIGAASGAAIFAGSAAVAGGYIEPVIAPASVVVEQPAPVDDWAGPYVGAALGYALGSDDVVGFKQLDGNGDIISRQNDLGAVDMKGVNLGAHVGYRWQKENWVFGPELAIEGGAIDGSDDTLAYGVTETESKLNYLVGLRMKTGYLTNPDTLIYGTFGVVHGDFDYSIKNAAGTETDNFSDTGISAGLGVERRLNEKLSVYGEWEYRHFERSDATYDANLLTHPTPKHHNLKVGLNYRF